MKNSKTYIYPIITTLLWLGLMTLIAFRYPILSALSLPAGAFWPIFVGLACLTAIAAFFMLQDWKKSLALSHSLPLSVQPMQETPLPLDPQETARDAHTSTPIAASKQSTSNAQQTPPAVDVEKAIAHIDGDYQSFARCIMENSKPIKARHFSNIRKKGEVQCFLLAIKYGHTDYIKYIANEMSHSFQRLSDALMTAIEAGQLGSLKTLSECYTKQWMQCTISARHLLEAAFYGNVDIIRWLFEHGNLQPSDINTIQGKELNSPLLMAATRNHVEASVYLTQQGGDPSIRNRNGNNTLEYAQLYGWLPEIIALLQGSVPTNDGEELTGSVSRLG